VLLKRFYYDKLAQASYLIGCQATGEAVVIDAHRDTDVYLRAVGEEGLRVRYVTETHIHADYLSGSRQLAARTGAQLLLSGEGDETWQYGFAADDGARLLRDGDEVELGNVRLRVLHTPGHTPEHISFLVTDRAATDQPLGLLTGDFVFVGDVGRPDLLEKAAGFVHTMEAGARSLFRSLTRLVELPDYLQILPGHGAGSACGKALGAVPTSTLGYERLVNWAFQCKTEDEFVAKVLEDQPEPPTYFAEMKRMNRDGPLILDRLPEPPPLSGTSLSAVVESGGVVVDVRPRAAFAAGHVPGTLSVSLGDDFPGWCGWILPYDRPIHLIAPTAEAAREAASDLAFIGIDAVVGYFDGEDLKRWSREHGPLQTIPSIDWASAERAAAEEDGILVDVRGESEWRAGHVPSAVHMHFGSLARRGDELPRDRPLMLYCLGGGRSGVAAGVLQAAGFADVRSVEGGLGARVAAGAPVVHG
jgi:hydroxyacylglutathione hydrolase